MRFLPLLGIPLGVVLTFGAYQVSETYQWTGRVDAQAKAGAASYQFLASPVVGLDGKPLTKNGKDLTYADALAILVKIRIEEESKRAALAPSGPGAHDGKSAR